MLAHILKQFEELYEATVVFGDKHNREKGPWQEAKARKRTQKQASKPAADKPSTSDHRSSSIQDASCNRGGPAGPSGSKATGEAAAPTATASTRSPPQHSDPSWLKRAQHRDQRMQHAKRASRILRGSISEVARTLEVEIEEDSSNSAARLAQLKKAVQRILQKTGASDAAKAVQSVSCLGYGYSTLRVVFTSAAVIQRSQRAIKQGLQKLCAGMPARNALYLDEDLTRLQQAIRTARRPTYDYLRSQQRAGKLQGVIAVSMVGCSIMLLRNGTQGQKRWTPYEGQWYSSALGTSPSPHEQHPYVRVGCATQHAQR